MNERPILHSVRHFGGESFQLLYEGHVHYAGYFIGHVCRLT